MEFIFAGVGGSVGRGEADEYSDIDLIVYLDDRVSLHKVDLEYNGEIIQLEIHSKNDVPSKGDIVQSSWENRFIAEQKIIIDTNDEFRKLQDWTTSYLYSNAGKKKIVNQVSKIVNERVEFSLKCIEMKKHYSASLAAMGAWSEAAFLFTFVYDHSFSTSNVITQLRTLPHHLERFQKFSPLSLSEDMYEVYNIVRNFRKYLKGQGHTNSELADIHDILCERKMKRLENRNEKLNLVWQMYGEAVGLYFKTSNGLTVEQYFQQLPDQIQEELSRIGFMPLEEDRIEQLNELSKELISIASKTVVEN